MLRWPLAMLVSLVTDCGGSKPAPSTAPAPAPPTPATPAPPAPATPAPDPMAQPAPDPPGGGGAEPEPALEAALAGDDRVAPKQSARPPPPTAKPPATRGAPPTKGKNARQSSDPCQGGE